MARRPRTRTTTRAACGVLLAATLAIIAEQLAGGRSTSFVTGPLGLRTSRSVPYRPVARDLGHIAMQQAASTPPAVPPTNTSTVASARPSQAAPTSPAVPSTQTPSIESSTPKQVPTQQAASASPAVPPTKVPSIDSVTPQSQATLQAAAAVSAPSAVSPSEASSTESVKPKSQAASPAPVKTSSIEKAKPKSQVTALVAITPGNSRTAAAVTGAAAGLSLSGGVLGTALAATFFVITAYLGKKRNDDISLALEYIGKNSLRAVNFVTYLAVKYDLVGAVSAAVEDLVARAEAQFEHALDDQTKRTFAGVRDYVVDVVTRVEKDYGIVNLVGSFVEGAANTAGEAAAGLIAWEQEYNVRGKLADAWKDWSASRERRRA